MWGHSAAYEVGPARPALHARASGGCGRRRRQRLIGRLRQPVSDDTVEIIKDRDGNKESLEGILKEISIPRTVADEGRGHFEREGRPALGKQEEKRNKDREMPSWIDRLGIDQRPDRCVNRQKCR